MKIETSVLVRALLCLLISMAPVFKPAVPIDRRSHTTVTSLPLEGSLSSVLRGLASEFHEPMIVELVTPEPQVSIPPDIKTLDSALDYIVSRFRPYKWVKNGAVVHFYSPEIEAQSQNFMNIILPTFTISGTVGIVDLRLRGEINKSIHGISSSGLLVEGILKPDLRKLQLPTAQVENASVRDILFRLGNLSPHVYICARFPKSAHLSLMQVSDALTNWEWVALPQS